MASLEGCMLTRKTYTPALEAEAAPILPGVAAVRVGSKESPTNGVRILSSRFDLIGFT